MGLSTNQQKTCVFAGYLRLAMLKMSFFSIPNLENLVSACTAHGSPGLCDNLEELGINFDSEELELFLVDGYPLVN